jgi:hypothetical protein
LPTFADFADAMSLTMTLAANTSEAALSESALTAFVTPLNQTASVQRECSLD